MRPSAVANRRRSAKAGDAPDAVLAAIRGGLAGSTVLEAKVPMMLDHSGLVQHCEPLATTTLTQTEMRRSQS